MTPHEALFAEVDRQLALLAALALMCDHSESADLGGLVDWYLRERHRTTALLKLTLSLI
jgi:hypothetical protein